MKVRVAVNGFGVIGRRVADAVRAQADMELAGIADVATDWRMQVARERGIASCTRRRGCDTSSKVARNTN